ncbi:MAG: B-box zinc finger protein, partial [Actinomycetota bacterium]|nr:B-box zinc finger protein [Actinomycetota bacterium]
MYCINHPKEQTYLRCGKCGNPICARCRVSTPAGFRCYTCANLQVLPTYAVSSSYYLRAAAAGLVAGGIAGVLMGLFPGFEFWGALLMGIAVPEAVSVAANQKRGPGLQMVGVGSVVFGFIVSRIVINAFPLLIPLGGVNFPQLSGIDALDSLPFYLTQYS